MGISGMPFPASLAPLRQSRREDGLVSYARRTSPSALGGLAILKSAPLSLAREMNGGRLVLVYPWRYSPAVRFYTF